MIIFIFLLEIRILYPLRTLVLRILKYLSILIISFLMNILSIFIYHEEIILLLGVFK